MLSLFTLVNLWTEAGARQVFERLVTHCVRLKHPQARAIRVSQGDGGLDTFDGFFDTEIDVWQAKYFHTSVDEDQRGQIRKSFNRVVSNPRIKKINGYTLCLPINLSQDEEVWWQGWSAGKKTETGIDIKIWTLDDFEGFYAKPELKAIFELVLRQSISLTLEELLATINPPIACWNVPVLRDPFFVNRQVEIETIDKLLTNRGFMSITGLSGVGKSALCAEVAHRNPDRFDITWWIDARSEATIRNDLATLAHELGLTKASEDEQLSELALRWLQRNGGWFLIFDRSEDALGTKKLIPTKQSGATIVCSLSQPDWEGMGNMLALKPIPREDAKQFFCQRNGMTQSEADELCAELGDLPVAMVQASSYMMAAALPAPEFLLLLRARRQELVMTQGLVSPTHPAPFFATWDLCFDQIKEKKGAFEVLCRCAYLDSDQIPVALLIDAGTPESAQFNLGLIESIIELRRYSMLDRSGSYVSVHPLVQDVLRCELEQSKDTMHVDSALARAESLFPRAAADYQNWLEAREVLKHCMRLLQHVNNLGRESVSAITLSNLLGVYFMANLELDSALRYFENAHTICVTLFGEGSSEDAECLNNMAKALINLGRAPGAVEIATRAMNAAGSNEKYELLVDCMDTFACAVLECGQPIEGYELFIRNLAVTEQVFGEDTLQYAVTEFNLARTLHQLGRFGEAIDYFNRSIALRSQLQGASHGDIAAIWNSMAYTFEAKGDLEDAIAASTKACQIAESAFGENHKVSEAYRKNRAAIEAGERPDPLYYFRRGNLRLAAGENGDAAADFTQALVLEPKLTPALFNRALARARNDEYALAAEDFRAMTIREPNNHEVWSHFGDMCGRSGNVTQALAAIDRSLQINKDYPQAYFNRGVLHARKGQSDLALTDFNTAIKLKPDFADAYLNRASLQANAKLALEDLDSAFKLGSRRKELFLHRGEIRLKMGMDRGALSDLDECLRQDPQEDLAYLLRGNVYGALEQYDLAISDYSHCYFLNPRQYTALFYRGLAHDKRREFKEAIRDYRSFLDRAEQNDEMRTPIRLSRERIQTLESEVSG
jgi:tetratricopeptide (TPR) repeat protein